MLLTTGVHASFLFLLGTWIFAFWFSGIFPLAFFSVTGCSACLFSGWAVQVTVIVFLIALPVSIFNFS
jgi:hypothetical protein